MDVMKSPRPLVQDCSTSHCKLETGMTCCLCLQFLQMTLESGVKRQSLDNGDAIYLKVEMIMQIFRNALSQKTLTMLHLIIHTSIAFILSGSHKEIAVSTNVKDCQLPPRSKRYKHFTLVR